MNDTTNSDQDPANTSNNSFFKIHNVYIKDISFESPNRSDFFETEWHPELKTLITTTSHKIDKDVHEVILIITITAKVSGKTAYLIEVHQAGIFTIRDYSTDAALELLGIYCPSVLYPFAREVINDLIVKGGFPPNLLGIVNFQEEYDKRKQQQE